VDLQLGGNAGSGRSYNTGHNLRSSGVYGPRLLDTCFLGSSLVGDALHHVCRPLPSPERRNDGTGRRVERAVPGFLRTGSNAVMELKRRSEVGRRTFLFRPLRIVMPSRDHTNVQD